MSRRLYARDEDHTNIHNRFTPYQWSGCCLVSQHHDPIFSLTLPSKVQPCMACGRPIIASLDGEGTRVIRESGAGIVVAAEDPKSLADAVKTMAALDHDERERMGQRGREYYDQHFARAYLLDRFERELMNKKEQDE